MMSEFIMNSYGQDGRLREVKRLFLMVQEGHFVDSCVTCKYEAGG